MSVIIFNGKEYARQKELFLKKKVQTLSARGKTFNVKSITFVEDEGSRIYTMLKAQAASRIGILYEPMERSLTEPIEYLAHDIYQYSHDARVTGVMVQKPSQQSWEKSQEGGRKQGFADWWESLTSAIDPKKDVDCLTTHNLSHILDPKPATSYTLLPATVQACLSILQEAKEKLAILDSTWKKKAVIVIGRSDIVGKPLAQILRKQFSSVRNVGRSELEDLEGNLSAFDIVISAVGKPNLVTGEMVRDGVIAIDVGAPEGDFERSSVEPRAVFLTPVPGGVGPVTVVGLMENIVSLS